jgi:hypothetical protein
MCDACDQEQEELESEVDATARRMLARYSTPKVAAAMAWDHACGQIDAQNPGMVAYWRAVDARIRVLGAVRRAAH